MDQTRSIDQDQARAMFGAKLEGFGEVLGREAKERAILGFACIVITEQGISVISGGDSEEEWRATLRRVAGRVADEMGQVLIAKGIAQKPGRA